MKDSPQWHDSRCIVLGIKADLSIGLGTWDLYVDTDGDRKDSSLLYRWQAFKDHLTQCTDFLLRVLTELLHD